MASPQTENGYTRIANELLDAVVSYGFSKRQLLVIFHVIRKTYGYNKKRDDMSLSQIANATKIKPPHVSVALRELESQKVLLIQEGAHAQSIGINKNYAEWGVTETVRVTETVTGYQNSNRGVTETVRKGLLKQEPQKTTQKTTPKDKARKRAMSASDLVAQGVDEQHARDWLTARKSPLTETAWNGVVREAGKAGISVGEAVRIAAERGWRGFNASWDWQGSADRPAASIDIESLIRQAVAADRTTTANPKLDEACKRVGWGRLMGMDPFNRKALIAEVEAKYAEVMRGH